MTESQEREQVLHELAAVTGVKLVHLRRTHRHLDIDGLRRDLDAERRSSAALVEELMELNPEFHQAALELLDQVALGNLRVQLEIDLGLQRECETPPCRDVLQLA